LNLLSFTQAHLEESAKQGVLTLVLNNSLYKEMIKGVDYDSTQINRQHKSLLEVHIKLSGLEEAVKARADTLE
jgi:hypothetical protein